MDDELDYSDLQEYDDVAEDQRDRRSESDDPEQPKDEMDEIIDRKEKIATEKAFGLSEPKDTHLCVSHEESRALRKELGAGEDFRLDSVIVHGVEKMNEFDIQKMFGDFRAEQVYKDDSFAVVQFRYREEATAMMLNMSKMMRRVRGRKTADEEGEVMSDDDDDVEEGQIMQEKGDDVELIDGLKPNEKGIVNSDKKSEFVTVDVSARDIPDGKWRVVTKHVPVDMFVIVRYPKKQEFMKVVRSRSTEEKRMPVKREREQFWTHQSASRGGLNVFDKDGKELEWDYEHDTRFYAEEDKAEKTPKVQLPSGVKVRGRGAVKCGFLFGQGSSSLASDDASSTKKKKIDEGGSSYEKDDVVARMGTAAHAIRPGQSARPMRDRIRFPGASDDH